jgi:hypothetical protein
MPFNHHLPAEGAAGLALAELLDRLGWQDAACDLQSNIIGDYAGKRLHPDDIRADADAMKGWAEKALFTCIAEGLARERINDAKRAEAAAKLKASLAALRGESIGA